MIGLFTSTSAAAVPLDGTASSFFLGSRSCFSHALALLVGQLTNDFLSFLTNFLQLRLSRFHLRACSARLNLLPWSAEQHSFPVRRLLTSFWTLEHYYCSDSAICERGRRFWR